MTKPATPPETAFHPRDFAGQFLLAPAGRPAPPGAATLALGGGLRLDTLAPLRVIPVSDAAGMPLGHLLGTPVDWRAGRAVTGPLVLPAVPEGDLDAFVETHVHGLGGSFLFVLDRDGVRRLYLDACGTLSAVWDPERGAAAATAPLLLAPEEAAARFERDLHAALRVERDGWFPAGLTAHRGIRRLLPNHYLDLATWTAHRHWPRGPVPRAGDPQAACGRILASARGTIAGLAGAGSVFVALTAGNEARMLLAAARALTDEVEFVTVRAEGAALDVAVAGTLARRFGLQHRILPLVTGSEADAADWRARAGHCVGGPHVRTHPTMAPLRARDYFLGGQSGEVGRGFFWRPGDGPDTPLDAAGITARLGMPFHPRVRDAVAEWLPGVAGLDALLVLDLAYLELRMGAWGFALSYCVPRPVKAFPLVSRASFAAMLSLPPEWRRMAGKTNRMITETIAQGWPELLEVPMNRYGDWRDRLTLLTRLLRQPHLAAKKLRKRFG